MDTCSRFDARLCCGNWPYVGFINNPDLNPDLNFHFISRVFVDTDWPVTQRGVIKVDSKLTFGPKPRFLV